MLAMSFAAGAKGVPPAIHEVMPTTADRFFQEQKAERALSALKSLAAPKTKTVRKGQTRVLRR